MPDLDKYKDLCMGCTNAHLQEDGICPECGFDESEYHTTEQQLPLRHLLQDRYIVGKLVDINGEGIGYIGYDVVMHCTVYIREFMPGNLCQRKEETQKLVVIPGCEIAFQENLELFLKYFRSVAQLRETSSFIPIFNIFEENNTAYTISEWVENITLKEFVERSGEKITWSSARPLFMPVLSTLISMQKLGINHLGINPENLIVLREGRMMLKGFAIPTIRQVDTDLRPELYDGCSALEQYVGSAEMGEYTDIYGFTASLFYALTSKLPDNAVKRKTDERLLIPKSDLRVIPPHIISSLAEGLQLLAKRRLSSFEQLRDSLSASPSISQVMDDIASDEGEKNKKKSSKRKKRNITISVVSGVVALIIFGAIAFFATDLFKNDTQTDDASSIVMSINSSSKQASSIYSASSSSSSRTSSQSTESSYYLPNLVGQNYEDAKQEAAKSKYYEIVLSSEEFNDNTPSGCIISQNPAYSSDKQIRSGTIIAVVVSKGSKYKTLPNISGLTLSQASTKLTELGLVPQKGKEEYSAIYEEGIVVGYESNKVGDLVEYGSTVKIVTSKGIS